jgi:hypothetical protein
MKHSYNTQKAKKISRRSSRRRKIANDMKSGKAKQNGKKELGKD